MKYVFEARWELSASGLGWGHKSQGAGHGCLLRITKAGKTGAIGCYRT